MISTPFGRALLLVDWALSVDGYLYNKHNGLIWGKQ